MNGLGVGISIVFEILSQFPISGGLPHSKSPRGSRNLKFTIYAFLVPKIHHIKFEKNRNSGYQGLKNVHMLTDTIYHV
jgi:hypothetical protein